MTGERLAPELSVVICTCGRIPGLHQVLEGLAACDGANQPGWEVVVVDNRPSEGTEALARTFVRRLPIRYVAEPKAGLSCARNRGVAASRGETIWFLDDDLRLAPSWLQAAREAIRSYPEATFLGGRMLVDWGKHALPKWLRSEEIGRAGHATMAAHYDLGNVARPLQLDEILVEGNMGIRRSAFAQVGGFRTDMGLAPERPRGMGEGPDFIARVRAMGAVGYYVPGATAHHPFSPDRLTISYSLNWSYNMGRFAQKMKALHQSRLGQHTLFYPVLEILRNGLRVAVRLPAALVLVWFVGMCMRVEYWMLLARSLGRLAESFAPQPDLALDWPEVLKEREA